MRTTELRYLTKASTCTEELNQSSTESSIEGLADALQHTWPPNMVESGMKKKATLFFSFLMVLYFIYGFGSVATTLQKRLKPPVSLSRNTKDTSFTAPYFTFCNNDNAYVEVRCAYGLQKENLRRLCDMNDNTYFQYYNSDDIDTRSCTSVEILEAITSSAPSITLYITGAVDGKLTYYISDRKLDENALLGTESNAYDIGVFQKFGRYEMEITKEIYFHLMATAGGLGISREKTVTYNANALYTSDEVNGVEYFEENLSNNSPTSSPTMSPISDSSVDSSSESATSTEAIIVVLFSNSLGVDKLEEVDPVDALSLIGSIAGVLPYVLLIFSVVFSKSIYRKMKRMEYLHHIGMVELTSNNPARTIV